MLIVFKSNEIVKENLTPIKIELKKLKKYPKNSPLVNSRALPEALGFRAENKENIQRYTSI